MAEEKSRLKDTLISYDGKPPKKSNRRFLIVIFILMVVLLVAFSFVYNLYASNAKSYETNIYQNNLVQIEENNEQVNNEEHIYAHLLIALDHREIGGQQFEDASWASLWLFNTNKRTYQQLIIPMNSEIVDPFNNQLINNYIEDGVSGLVKSIAQATDISIDSVSSVRLAEMRPIVETLGQIELNFEEEIDLEDRTYEADQTYQVTGRQFEKLLYLDQDLLSESKDRHQMDLLTDLFSQIYSLDHLLVMEEFYEEAHFGIQSSLSYNQLLRLLLLNYTLDHSLLLTEEVAYETVDNGYGTTYQIKSSDWESFIKEFYRNSKLMNKEESER